MKAYTFFFDCHWNGPTPIDVEQRFGPRVVYGGDNHEFKNIPKKLVDGLKIDYFNFNRKCRETKTINIDGNHEISVGEFTEKPKVAYIEDPDVKISTAVMHGDEKEGPKYRKKWEKKKPGKSKGYLYFIKAKNFFGGLHGKTKLSKESIEFWTAKAKELKVGRVILGHTHPKRLIRETHNGIEIINCPRGMTELDLE